MRKVLFTIALALSCVVGVCLSGTGPDGDRMSVSAFFEQSAQGQDKSKTSKSSSSKSKKKGAVANVTGLDARAELAQTTFIKEAEDLAGQYADAGQPEKAKSILQSALALSPQSDVIQQKIKKLEESILTSNDFEVEVSPSKGWEPAGQVAENRPIRFQVDGNYRFVVNTTVSGAGFTDKDPVKDMAAGVPCGALMGMILTDGNKTGKPFAIGDGRDYTPKETGLLFLRINSPADNKHTGKLKVLISGYVKAAPKS